MKATLIYNKNAGRADQTHPEKLVEALRWMGYEPDCRATGSENELDQALADVTGLVVVAGGDGTVRAVAKRLIDRDVALTLLPLGTANNIGHALGIAGSPLEIIAGLKNPQKRHFDVGRAHLPWGEDYFLEGLGYGFFADILAEYDPDKGKSVPRSIETFVDTLSDYEAVHCRMKLDGRDLSGDYLMVEVLNTDSVGPRLHLAPDADPQDGLFEVVRIRRDGRDGLLRYLSSLLSEELEELPSVEVNRGRRLELVWTGFPIHVDAEVHPKMRKSDGQTEPGPSEAKEKEVLAEVTPNALEIWLPQPPQRDE